MSGSGHKREEKGNDIVSGRRAAKRDTNDWIDEAEEHDVRGHGPEVIEALCQRISQIDQSDRADSRKLLRRLGGQNDIRVWHDRSSPRVESSSSGRGRFIELS
jgi:hypothetical protein